MSNELKSGVARRATLGFACLVGVLGLAACGDESGNPTQPQTGAGPQAPSLATASSNTWTTKAPMPDGDGDIFGAQVAGVLSDAAGRSVVYVFGGRSSSGGGATGQVAVYTVATNTWTWRSLGCSPPPVLGCATLTDFNGVGKIGNKFYLSGGRDEEWTRSLFVYDPATNSTTRKADMPLYTGEGVAGVIDDKLYVLPGTCSGEGWPDPGWCSPQDNRRFFRYNPATDTWATRPWAPHFHRCGAGGVIDGKFYVAGGQLHNGSNVADLDVYDPVTNKWKTLASLPRAGCAVAAVMNHKFFVVSGNPFTGATNMYAYDPVTNSWTTKTPPSAARAVARVTVDGRNRLFSAGPPSELYTP